MKHPAPEPSDPLQKHIDWFVEEEGCHVVAQTPDSAKLRSLPSSKAELGNFLLSFLSGDGNEPARTKEEYFYLRVVDGKVRRTF